MPLLDAFTLANSLISPEEYLRRTLDDALKEYSDLDLLIELLQNALDGIDQRRYRLICGILGRDPEANDTILAWNKAVNNCIQRDYDEYVPADPLADTPTRRATVYVLGIMSRPDGTLGGQLWQNHLDSTKPS